MTGNFLMEQLQMLDNAAGGKATFAFGATAFATSLMTEVSILWGRAASDTKAVPVQMSWRHQSAALDHAVQSMTSFSSQCTAVKHSILHAMWHPGVAVL